jgi:hypothetical protein
MGVELIREEERMQMIPNFIAWTIRVCEVPFNEREK